MSFARCVLFLMVASFGATFVSAQSPELTILHTNDTHGHLLPFSYPDSAVQGPGMEGLAIHRDIGGIARRAALANRIRREVAARKGTTWLVDVGDYSDGTPFSTEYRGEADVAAMNAARYDFGTLGNHEFNYPAAHVRSLVGQTKYELLCANVTGRDDGRPLARASTIRRVGPVRVAIFGLITRSAASYPAGKEAFEVAAEVETARRVVTSLKGRADIVVLLSHAGEDVDEQIAAAVPDIDVIVGGHSHSRLPSGRLHWRSEDLSASDVNGTVIVQAHQWGGELGRLDLLFGKDSQGRWQVTRYRARLLPITPDMPEDPPVASVVRKYWEPISGIYGEVIGEAADEFTSRGDDQAEYNLMADALRESTGADFAVENMGGIRAPLLRGTVTRADLVALDPFDNTLVRFQASGRRIRALLQRHAPAVSGIRYRMQARELVEVTIGGLSLEDDRVYEGVTNSFFAGVALKDLKLDDTGKARLEALVAFIRGHKTIRPSYDGRRVVVGD